MSHQRNHPLPTIFTTHSGFFAHLGSMTNLWLGADLGTHAMLWFVAEAVLGMVTHLFLEWMKLKNQSTNLLPAILEQYFLKKQYFLVVQ